MTRYALDPATPVLSRPDGCVQVGWDPRRAVVVRPPDGLPAAVLAELLRALQDAATVSDLQSRAAQHGVPADAVSDLLTGLLSTGVATTAVAPRARSAAVRIHGSGPLSDLLSTALRANNVRVSRSSRTHASTGSAELAVLTDYLVADPRVVRDLQDAGVAHLPVRVRDGTGLIGPLVIPGVTSCLRCADMHRSDRDAAWPAVASQLCQTVGTADRATVLATAGLALGEIDRVLGALAHDGTAPAPAPLTLDTTLEFDVRTGSVATRRWSRHPNCWC
ncbi:cyclodehydratase [Mycobacterium sp. SMC-4]|uniref:cyclodehydratase n=1 Tax=Mycobacterium sp. SMC-4 TaxID=2857059 RepID=UPI0021B250E9|nr:cyclodehydratase [Mycobacterium sp. SMC-4]UXA19381.1 cyclodehydratase [Mycobacterium sp. SMC-4]